MTDGPHTWLVRLWYQAPAPEDRHDRLIDYLRQEELTEHSAAHGIARRWATTPLPAGAVLATVELTIEERIGTRIIRTEPWPLGSRVSTAAETLDQARTRLRSVG